MVMQTGDGRWRVEVIQRGTHHGYRLLCAQRDVELDLLAVGTVEHTLAKEGHSMADLVEAGASATSSLPSGAG